MNKDLEDSAKNNSNNGDIIYDKNMLRILHVSTPLLQQPNRLGYHQPKFTGEQTGLGRSSCPSYILSRW